VARVLCAAVPCAASTRCLASNFDGGRPPLLLRATARSPRSLRRASAPRKDAAGEPVVFARLSELLADEEFWAGAPQASRLERLGQWIGSLTLNSRAYLIEMENRAAPPSGPRLASRSKIESLVATDKGQNQVVFWRYLE